MKTFKLFLFASLLAIGLSSCDSVRVSNDYDQNVNFNQYQSFAFYKPGIDKAKISDLDKRRILSAIDKSLQAKGMTKSEEPDLLVSIYTDATENVNIYQHYYGYGFYNWYNPWYWGYDPYYWGPYDRYYGTSYTDVQGTLYIDLIDAKTKTLVWQGMGVGVISPEGSVSQKVERINEIVGKVLDQYPPGTPKK